MIFRVFLEMGCGKIVIRNDEGTPQNRIWFSSREDEEAVQQFLDPNSSLPESGPGSGSTRSLWKRKNKVKSGFFSEKACLE